MKTIIIKKELEVPLDVFIDVARVLVDHNLSHTIIDTDEEEEIILLEVAYEKEEGHLFRQIEAIISEYEDGDDEDDDDNEEDDEEDEG